MGLINALRLDKLRKGLTKTRENLLSALGHITGSSKVMDEAMLEHLEETLISGDVGVETTHAVISALRERSRQTEADEEIPLLVREVLREQFLLHSAENGVDPYALSPSKPHIVMIVGINGVGKTTTTGKLAHNHKRLGRKVMIAAADTFRAAANEQLEIWAERAGASIVRQAHGSDPASVAFDAIRSAEAQGVDVVLIDTAGRLHTRVNLMEELKKIRRVIQKQKPDAPHEVLLVIDASTGQNGIQQARQFSVAVGVTGLVLTKLDGTAKGGVVLSITRELGVPVRFVGVGEGIEDLEPFDRESFVNALL